jgi:hypothetical protein
VKTGSLPNARAVQLIDVATGNSGFVRLPTGSRIRIEEVWLGGNHA